MKNTLLTILLFISFSMVSQKPNDVFNPKKKDTYSINYLDSLILVKINKVREENNLKPLYFDNRLNIESKNNSYKGYLMPEPNIKHFEKGDFYEICGMTDILINNNSTSYNDIVSIMIFCWLDSPPHKKIIMRDDLKSFGGGSIIDYKIIKNSVPYFNENREISYRDGKRFYIWSTVRFKD